MSRTRAWHASFFAVVLLGCSEDDEPMKGGAGDVEGDDSGTHSPDGDRDAGHELMSDSGAPESCEPFGHFGPTTTSFTLPAGKESISYPDVQKSFPDVDWQAIDRLYVPAGAYKTFQLGNLPVRDPAKPLVITNIGGQVRVGPNLGGNFIWSMGGGSNWVLTGRYDPESQTGDEGFPGHRCGAYADSRDRYGFISDDAFDHSGKYTHMGMAIGGGATDFEIEYVEVTRSGFAGIRLLNADGNGKPIPTQPMANVRVHDTYVHDVDSEGFYFGWTGEPPSHLMRGLQVYNNRIVRTGSETLQVQDLGEGSTVHHNVFAYGALHWLDNFGKYQDGNLQIHVRTGAVTFEHNIVFGGASTFLSFFNAPEGADGPSDVTFHDNYFADTRSLGGYLNGSSATTSRFTFRGNVFRGLDFGYTPVDPNAKDPGVVFGVNDEHMAPVLFDANRIDSARQLVWGVALNGARDNVSATNNVMQAVPAVAFVASGFPDVPTSKLSAWGAKATLAPNQPDIAYAVGDLVMHDAQLYRATAANTNQVPNEHPESWEKLPLPSDDFRLAPSSPYSSMGIR